MLAIEKSNTSLKGVLPINYAREALNKTMLGELIDLISTIGMNKEDDKSKDILGRVYEYFLGGFAGAEGKRGGEYFTPRSIVRVLTEMLEPYKGRVYETMGDLNDKFGNYELAIKNLKESLALKTKYKDWP